MSTEALETTYRIVTMSKVIIFHLLIFKERYSTVTFCVALESCMQPTSGQSTVVQLHTEMNSKKHRQSSYVSVIWLLCSRIYSSPFPCSVLFRESCICQAPWPTGFWDVQSNWRMRSRRGVRVLLPLAFSFKRGLTSACL